MTYTGLFDILGIDSDDPQAVGSLEDAQDYERLIDSFFEARRRIGLSQSAVAERMQTTQSAVSDLERLGGDAFYSTLQRLARALGGRLASRFVFDEWRNVGSVLPSARAVRDVESGEHQDRQIVVRPTLQMAS